MHNFSHYRRRFLRLALELKLLTGVYQKRVALRYHKHVKNFYRFLGLSCFGFLLFFVGFRLAHYKSSLTTDAEALSTSGTIPQMGIAVGAAMLGVIGIVFSLSLFSIQQVAERGTSLTLKEYARDWVLRLVYSILAAFTISAIVAALFKKESAVFAVMINLIILVGTVCLLKLYFNRTIKFSDPHFIVSKIASRAKKSLRTIQQMEKVMEREVRYQRRKERN